jgi:hypothetical protein
VSEEWREVEVAPRYEVSNLGRVRNKKSGRVLSGSPHATLGYVLVGVLPVRSGGRAAYVHRLVAQAFLGAPPPRYEVNHKNGIRFDNRLENLEWVTHSQNNKHSYDVLGRPRTYGERSGRSTLTPDAVRSIRALWDDGRTREEIAAQFGISTSSVRAIVTRKRWAHIG